MDYKRVTLISYYGVICIRIFGPGHLSKTSTGTEIAMQDDGQDAFVTVMTVITTFRPLSV